MSIVVLHNKLIFPHTLFGKYIKQLSIAIPIYLFGYIRMIQIRELKTT